MTDRQEVHDLSLDTQISLDASERQDGINRITDYRTSARGIVMDIFPQYFTSTDKLDLSKTKSILAGQVEPIDVLKSKIQAGLVVARQFFLTAVGKESHMDSDNKLIDGDELVYADALELYLAMVSHPIHTKNIQSIVSKQNTILYEYFAHTMFEARAKMLNSHIMDITEKDYEPLTRRAGDAILFLEDKKLIKVNRPRIGRVYSEDIEIPKRVETLFRDTSA